MEPHTLSFNPITGDSSSVVNPGTVEIVFVLVGRRRHEFQNTKTAGDDKEEESQLRQRRQAATTLNQNARVQIAVFHRWRRREDTFVWLQCWDDFMQQ